MTVKISPAPSTPVVAGYGTTPNTATAGQLAIDVQVDVQEFSSNGTWTKPSWASASSLVIVELVGAGGQGGTGRRGAAGTLRCGGGGGQAGFRSQAIFKAGDLPATVTVTVGVGGTSVNNATSDDTDGSAGVIGGQTKFGQYVVASGGGGGLGGNNTAGGTGGTTQASARGLTAGGPGVQGSDTTTKDPDLILDGVWGAGVLSKNVVNGGGGGGGAGITAANANVIGSRGGDVDGYADGTVQGGAAGAGALNGSTGNTADAYSASGGGGGGRANGANALAGGTGGFPGGGGGGGGAALNGFTAGIGGTGGAGFCRVVTHP
jgi:hypothetical protein